MRMATLLHRRCFMSTDIYSMGYSNIPVRDIKQHDILPGDKLTFAWRQTVEQRSRVWWHELDNAYALQEE